MATTSDVIVVGGGVIGSSVAYHLAKKGAKVLVVDRPRSGRTASVVAAGMLAAQEEATELGPKLELNLASRDLFPALVAEVREETGMDPQWRKCGLWRVAGTDADVAELKEKRAWQVKRQLSVEWVDAAELHRREPALAPCAAALFFPEDGQINSALWTESLAEAARRRGARYVTHTDDVVLARVGRRGVGVSIDGEIFETEQVVVAAGPWTPGLLGPLGIVLPLEPVKGQVLVAGEASSVVRSPLYVAGGYVVPQPNGRAIVGSTVEHVGFDDRPTLDAERHLAAWAARWFPTLALSPAVDVWAGLRPGSRDGWPVMGRLWDYDNLFVAAGHFRNGILQSPWTGRYMADGLLNNRWDPLGAAFAPERFAAPTGGSVA